MFDCSREGGVAFEFGSADGCVLCAMPSEWRAEAGCNILGVSGNYVCTDSLRLNYAPVSAFSRAFTKTAYPVSQRLAGRRQHFGGKLCGRIICDGLAQLGVSSFQKPDQRACRFILNMRCRRLAGESCRAA